MNNSYLKTFNSILFLFGLSLSVLYFNDGAGRIQLGHVIIFFAIFFNFLVIKKLKFNFIELLLFLLCFYILIVDVFDFFVNKHKITFFRVSSTSIYILFNVLVMHFVRNYFNLNNLNYIILFVVFSICFCFLFIDYSSLSIFKGAPRLAAGFRNPNQLGYFAVVCFSIGILLLLLENQNKFFSYIIIFSSIFFSMISLSKASMLAIFFSSILFLIFFSIKKIIFEKSISLYSLIGFFTLLIFYLIPKEFKSNLNFYNRLASIAEEEDSSLESRGYYTLFENNLFELFFGKGYWSSLYYHKLEIHSTFASLLINYGLVGFLIYGFFILFWFTFIFKKLGVMGVTLIVLPSLLYGITHNGTRFTFFYFLVSLSIVLLKNSFNIKYYNK